MILLEDKKGTISKIKVLLTLGSVETTSRNEVDYIVTEFGAARLKEKSLSKRANVLINIDHSNFREELKFEARKINLL